MSGVLPFDIFERYFSCFSSHMLEYKGILYSSTEHAYHSQRFTDQALIQEIRDARSALKAWEIAQKHKQEQTPDWNDTKVAVMEDLFRAKLAQHEDVKDALLRSGDAVIVKHQASDAFWGDGPDGKGQNRMGEIWMKLRSELQ